jgi:hypothetical protein
LPDLEASLGRRRCELGRSSSAYGGISRVFGKILK